MLFQARQILAGLVAAALTAAYILLLVNRDDGGAALSGLIPRLIRTALDFLPAAVPGVIVVIAASEWLRLRSAVSYMLAGAGVALLTVLVLHGGIPQSTLQPPDYAWTAPVLTMGVLAGLVYWGVRGRHAGLPTPPMLPASVPVAPTCRMCAALTFAALGVPLFAAGCWTLYESRTLQAIPQAVEQRVNTALKGSGFGWARVSIDDAVGRIMGAAPSEQERAAGYTKAVDILEPMTGLPGLISIVVDETNVSVSAAPAIPD